MTVSALLYSFFSSYIYLCLFAMMLLIEKYVFLEYSAIQKHMKLINASLITMFVSNFLASLTDYIPEVPDLIARVFYLFVLLSFLAGIGMPHFLENKKKRLTGFLYFIPLLGFIDVASMIVTDISTKLSGGDHIISLFIKCVFFTAVVIIFLAIHFKNPKWYQILKKDSETRILKGFQKHLLWTVGIYLIIEEEVYKCFFINSVPESFTIFYNIANSLLPISTLLIIITVNRTAFYHDQTVKLQRNLINAMADLVEGRDTNTGGHIHRTASYVNIIANKMLEMKIYPEVINKKYVEDMVIAAPLHDVGKIHVPDSILNKNGKLDNEEYAIMKEHAAYGSDVIKNVEAGIDDIHYLALADDMARYHHEWWNGNGYPDKILGEDIPVCARIMAVADVFDALSSKRCYKDSFSLEKSYSIIREETGTHFDPEVVKAFFAAQDQIEAVVKNSMAK